MIYEPAHILDQSFADIKRTSLLYQDETNRVCLELIYKLHHNFNSQFAKTDKITKNAIVWTHVYSSSMRSSSWWRFFLFVWKLVGIQYYTVTPSPWYELMEIRNQNWINGMFWIVTLSLTQQKKSKCTHLEFLRNHTLWPFPRKAWTGHSARTHSGMNAMPW